MSSSEDESEKTKSESMAQEARQTLRDIINNPGDANLAQDIGALYSLIMPGMDLEMQMSFNEFQTEYFKNPSWENLMNLKQQTIRLAGLFFHSIGHSIERKIKPWVFFSEMIEEIDAEAEEKKKQQDIKNSTNPSEHQNGADENGS